MKLIIWKKDPPPGFVLGAPPTDFGVGRSAYLWGDAKEGEKSCFSHGKMLRCTAYRGSGVLYRRDGSVVSFPFYHGPSGKELIDMLTEAAEDGFTIEET